MTPAAHTYRAVIGKTGSYAHTFGHDPQFQALIPPGGQFPAHLLLSLDMADPRLSFLRMNVGPMLRLVHPFRYSQGDRFAYRIGADGVTFAPADFAKIGSADWPTDDYPEQFPRRPVDLEAVSIDPDPFNTDRIFISHAQPTPQDDTEGSCEFCKAPTHLFAVVPSTPLLDLDVWGAGGQGVMAIFLYCSSCSAINTHNSCD